MDSLVEFLEGARLVTEKEHAEAVTRLEGIRLASQITLDNQKIFLLGNVLRTIASGGVRSNGTCLLVVEVLRLVDQDFLGECELPLSTFLLDPECAFFVRLAEVLECIITEYDSWIETCTIADFELCVRKIVEIIWSACEENHANEEARTFAKIAIGDLCLKHLVAFVAGSGHGVAASKNNMLHASREVLDAIAQLIYSCDHNARLVHDALKGCRHDAFIFLSTCGDFRTQMYYMDVLYRIHVPLPEVFDSFCGSFPDASLQALKAFLSPRPRYKTFDDIQRASRQFLIAFNGDLINEVSPSQITEGIKSFQIRRVDLHPPKGLRVEGWQAIKAAQKDSWIDVGKNHVCLDIDNVSGTLDVFSHNLDCMRPKSGTGKAQPHVLQLGLVNMCIGEIDVPKLILEITFCKAKDVQACMDWASAVSPPTMPIGSSKKISRSVPWQAVPKTAKASRKATEPSGPQPDAVKAFDVVIGESIGVWWEDDQCYYYCRIRQYDELNNRTHVQYEEDGHKEWLFLSEHKIDWCKLTSRAFKEKNAPKQPAVRQGRRAPVKSAANRGQASSAQEKKKAASQRAKGSVPSRIAQMKQASKPAEKANNAAKVPTLRAKPNKRSDAGKETKVAMPKEPSESIQVSTEPSASDVDDSEYEPECDVGVIQDVVATPPPKARAKAAGASKPKTVPKAPKKVARPLQRPHKQSHAVARKQPDPPPKRYAPKMRTEVRIPEAEHRDRSLSMQTPTSEDSSGDEHEESHEEQPTLEEDTTPMMTDSPLHSLEKGPKKRGNTRDPMKARARAHGAQKYKPAPNAIDSSTLDTSESVGDLAALRTMVKQIVSTRKQKHKKKRASLITSFEDRLQSDVMRLHDLLEGHAQDMIDVYDKMTRQHEEKLAAIKRAWEASNARYQKEIRTHQRAFKRCKKGMAEKQDEAKELIEAKKQEMQKELRGIRSDAEATYEKANQRMDELNRKSALAPKISKILTSIIEE